MISKIYLTCVGTVFGVSSMCNLFHSAKGMKLEGISKSLSSLSSTQSTSTSPSSTSSSTTSSTTPPLSSLLSSSLSYGLLFPLLPYTMYCDSNIIKRITNSSTRHQESRDSQQITERFYIYGDKSFTININP